MERLLAGIANIVAPKRLSSWDAGEFMNVTDTVW